MGSRTYLRYNDDLGSPTSRDRTRKYFFRYESTMCLPKNDYQESRHMRDNLVNSIKIKNLEDALYAKVNERYLDEIIVWVPNHLATDYLHWKMEPRSDYYQNNIRELRTYLIEKDKEITNLKYELQMTQHRCTERCQIISSQQDHIYKNTRMESEKNANLKELRIELNEMKKVNGKLKNDNKIKDDKIMELNVKLNLESNTIAEKKDKIYAREISLENSLRHSESQLNASRRNVEHLERKLKENECHLSKEKQRVEDLERSMSKIRMENNAHMRDITKSEMKIKETEEKLKQINARLNSKKENLVSETVDNGTEFKDRPKQSHQATSISRNDEIDNAKVIHALQNECKTQTENIFELERQLKEALQELENRDDEIRELESKQKDVRNIEANLEGKANTLETAIERKEAVIKEMNDMNRNLQNKLKEKEKQLIQQFEKEQFIKKQMNKKENEFIETIDLQSNEIQHLKNELQLNKDTLSNVGKSMKSRSSGRNREEVNTHMDDGKKVAELKEQLKKVITKLNETEAELAETKTRLSKAMGDRLTDNNPNITDLSDRNRPTKLAEKFAELYDNQWTDAFDVLEKKFSSEESVINALLHILQDVLSFCEKRATMQMENLGLELKLANKYGKGGVAADVRKLLKDCRKAVGMGAVSNLQAMYQSHLKHTPDERLKTALKVDAFTSECVEICWFMVIQDPPVAFAPLIRKGSNFDNDFYKPYTSSGTRVDFPVWPPLLLHAGGPILAKGVAQGCGKK